MPKENFKDFNLVYTDDSRLLDFAASIACLSLQEMESCEIKLTKKDFNFLKKILYENRKPLTKQQEKILFYHYWKKMKIREISSKLNIANGTVLAHLSHARGRIKAVLCRNTKR